MMYHTTVVKLSKMRVYIILLFFQHVRHIACQTTIEAKDILHTLTERVVLRYGALHKQIPVHPNFTLTQVKISLNDLSPDDFGIGPNDEKIANRDDMSQLSRIDENSSVINKMSSLQGDRRLRLGHDYGIKFPDGMTPLDSHAQHEDVKFWLRRVTWVSDKFEEVSIWALRVEYPSWYNRGASGRFAQAQRIPWQPFDKAEHSFFFPTHKVEIIPEIPIPKMAIPKTTTAQFHIYNVNLRTEKSGDVYSCEKHISEELTASGPSGSKVIVYTISQEVENWEPKEKGHAESADSDPKMIQKFQIQNAEIEFSTMLATSPLTAKCEPKALQKSELLLLHVRFANLEGGTEPTLASFLVNTQTKPASLIFDLHEKLTPVKHDLRKIDFNVSQFRTESGLGGGSLSISQWSLTDPQSGLAWDNGETKFGKRDASAVSHSKGLRFRLCDTSSGFEKTLQEGRLILTGGKSFPRPSKDKFKTGDNQNVVVRASGNDLTPSAELSGKNVRNPFEYPYNRLRIEPARDVYYAEDQHASLQSSTPLSMCARTATFVKSDTGTFTRSISSTPGQRDRVLTIDAPASVSVIPVKMLANRSCVFGFQSQEVGPAANYYMKKEGLGGRLFYHVEEPNPNFHKLQSGKGEEWLPRSLSPFIPPYRESENGITFESVQNPCETNNALQSDPDPARLAEHLLQVTVHDLRLTEFDPKSSLPWQPLSLPSSSMGPFQLAYGLEKFRKDKEFDTVPQKWIFGNRARWLEYTETDGKSGYNVVEVKSKYKLAPVTCSRSGLGNRMAMQEVFPVSNDQTKAQNFYSIIPDGDESVIQHLLSTNVIKLENNKSINVNLDRYAAEEFSTMYCSDGFLRSGAGLIHRDGSGDSNVAVDKIIWVVQVTYPTRYLDASLEPFGDVNKENFPHDAKGPALIQLGADNPASVWSSTLKFGTGFSLDLTIDIVEERDSLNRARASLDLAQGFALRKDSMSETTATESSRESGQATKLDFAVYKKVYAKGTDKGKLKKTLVPWNLPIEWRQKFRVLFGTKGVRKLAFDLRSVEQKSVPQNNWHRMQSYLGYETTKVNVLRVVPQFFHGDDSVGYYQLDTETWEAPEASKDDALSDHSESYRTQIPFNLVTELQRDRLPIPNSRSFLGELPENI